MNCIRLVLLVTIIQHTQSSHESGSMLVRPNSQFSWVPLLHQSINLFLDTALHGEIIYGGHIVRTAFPKVLIFRYLMLLMLF